MRFLFWKKKLLATGLVLILSAIFGFLYQNWFTIEWNVPDVQEINVECGQPYMDKFVTAKAMRLVGSGIQLEVTKTGDVDVSEPGLYVLRYEASYHGKKASVEKAVIVKDTTAPALTLAGEAIIQLEAGQEYIEPGYAAVDVCDGDLTKEVVVEGLSKVLSPGAHTLTYRVRDAAENEATATRELNIVDTLPPVIHLKGDEVNIAIGSDYTEPGFSAEDVWDGNCTDAVLVDGKVNTDKAGSYTLTYSVCDLAGNKATCTRVVKVYTPEPASSADAQIPASSSPQTSAQQQNGKVIYLTFDDGPGPYTQKLLDVLDKYGVKATFFVTNAQPKYRGMIGEEARRGHTVAIHTYTHEYSEIYKSVDAYLEDMQAMSNIIIEQTGQTPWLMRFPGGSSNLVSAKYCKGIMETLTQEVEARGYQYCDWNVSSGDAGETTSTSAVVENVTSGVQSKNVSVVLQHDIKEFSVNAVEEIIKWGQANGYTFLPITNGTTMVHHKIQN